MSRVDDGAAVGVEQRVGVGAEGRAKAAGDVEAKPGGTGGGGGGGLLGKLWGKVEANVVAVVAAAIIAVVTAASGWLIGWLNGVTIVTKDAIPAGPIAILQTSDTGPLQELAEGFREAQREDPDGRIWPADVGTYHAGGLNGETRARTLAQNAERAVGKKPSLVLCIGTPQYEAALRVVPPDVPIAFAATTSHSMTEDRVDDNRPAVSREGAEEFTPFGLNNYSDRIASGFVDAAKRFVGRDATIVFVRSDEYNAEPLAKDLAQRWESESGETPVLIAQANTWSGMRRKLEDVLEPDPVDGEPVADIFIFGYDNRVAAMGGDAAAFIRERHPGALIFSASFGAVRDGMAPFAYGYDYRQMGEHVYRLIRARLRGDVQLTGDCATYRPDPEALIDVDALSRVLWEREGGQPENLEIHPKVRSYHSEAVSGDVRLVFSSAGG